MSTDERISAEELLAHSAWMRKLALALVGDASSADDLVQQTVTTWIDHGPVPGGSVRPWLTKVMKNLVRSSWRRESRRREREIATARTEVQDAEDVAETLEMNQMLVAAIKSLQPSHQSVILRHHFKDESLAEIARSSGLAESTLRNRYLRALRELEAKLDRHYGDRANWVAIFAAFASRGQPLPVASAASAIGLGLLGWIAMSIALIVVGTGAGVWLSRDWPTTVEIPAEMFASVPADSVPSGEATVARAPAVGPRVPEGNAVFSAPSARSPRLGDPITTIEARIVGVDDLPSEGAELLLIGASGPVRSQSGDVDRPDTTRAKSGRDGRVSVEVPDPDRSSGAVKVGSSPDEWRVAYEVRAPDRAWRSGFIELKRGEAKSLGDIRLEPGGSLVGSVATKDRSALPPCRVDVLPLAAITGEDGPRRSIRREERVAQVLVEADGSYTVSGIPLGSYRVSTYVELGGWRSSISDALEVRTGETRTVPELTLERQKPGFSGTVRTPDGTPVGNRQVAYIESSLADTSVDKWKSVRADEHGNFEIALEQGLTCDLFVWPDGDASGDLLMRAVDSGTDDLDLRLPEPTWIEITVVDEDEVPVSEYSTSFSWTSKGPARFTKRGAHPEGKGRVLVHAKPFFFTVAAEGRAAPELGPFDPDRRTEPLTVRLAKIAMIHCHVVGSGAPIAGARVELCEVLDTEARHACNGFPCRMGRDTNLSPKHTNLEGRFDITRREPGRYVVVVRADGYADFESEPFDHDPAGANHELEIVLARGGRLEGHVIVERPASPEGVYIGVSRGDGSSRSFTVGADGTFHFDGLAAGRWAIRRTEHNLAAETGDTRGTVSGFDPSLQFVDVEDGRTTQFDLDLRNATCSVAGRFFQSACAGCSFTATLTEDPPVRGVKHKPVPLSSDGSFRVEARITGPHRLVIAGHVPGGRDQRIEQKLELERGTYAWALPFATGTLAGETEPNAELTHTWTNADGARCETRFSADASGRFKIDEIPAGAGKLTFARAGAALDVDVPAGSSLEVKPR